MPYEILRLDVAEGIATITISRPAALNALNSRFFRELEEMTTELRARDDLKAIILTGDGKAFVAGADIAEMAGMDPAQARAFARTGQKAFRALELLEIPVIAAVNGFALGGGCELAMACDIRIASTKAKFGQPEVNLGLIPGYGGTQRLPRLVGLGNALHLLFTADMIGAEEALRVGLVQRVVEPGQLMDEARKVAQKIASKGPKAVRNVKMVARQGLLSEFDTGSELEAERFGDTFGNEGTEGMKAFLEKREPTW